MEAGSFHCFLIFPRQTIYQIIENNLQNILSCSSWRHFSQITVQMLHILIAYIICNLFYNVSKCFCFMSIFLGHSYHLFLHSVQCDSSPSSFVITPLNLQMTVVCWWPDNHWEDLVPEVNMSVEWFPAAPLSVRIHRPVIDQYFHVDLSSCITGRDCCRCGVCELCQRLLIRVWFPLRRPPTLRSSKRRLTYLCQKKKKKKKSHVELVVLRTSRTAENTQRYIPSSSSVCVRVCVCVLGYFFFRLGLK